MATIVQEDRERRIVARELTSRHREFNERAAGTLNSKHIVLSVRADKFHT